MSTKQSPSVHDRIIGWLLTHPEHAVAVEKVRRTLKGWADTWLR